LKPHGVPVGALVCLIALAVAGAVLIGLRLTDGMSEPGEPALAANQSTPVATGVFAKGGGELPPEIVKAVPPAALASVWTIDMRALDCKRLEAILKASVDPHDRLSTITDEPSWQVEFVGRSGSLGPDTNNRILQLDVRGESPSQLRSLVEDISVTVTKVERPPTAGQACLYAVLRASPPQGVSAAFLANGARGCKSRRRCRQTAGEGHG
jgi:hypothetical protein